LMNPQDAEAHAQRPTRKVFEREVSMSTAAEIDHLDTQSWWADKKVALSATEKRCSGATFAPTVHNRKYRRSTTAPRVVTVTSCSAS